MHQADPLLGARLKVIRARHHLKTLDEETRAFAGTHPYRFDTELDPQTGEHVVRVRFRKPDVRVPLRLSLIVGDVVHNLRSALDHIAWQAAIVGTGPTRDTQFPIYDEPRKYRLNESRVLKGIVKGEWARFERLQPYHVKPILMDGGLVDARGPLVANLLLLALGRLDNMDKHRLLLPGVPVSPFRQPRFRGVKRAKGTYSSEWLRMEDGAEFYRITEIEVIPGAKVEVETPPSYTITFGDPERDIVLLWANESKAAASAADLQHTANAVDRIIDSFSDLFAGTPP